MNKFEPAEGFEFEGEITRREFIAKGLKLAGGLAGTYGVARWVLLPLIEEEHPSIQGGEILDDQDLVVKLNNLAGQNQSVTPDPTVLRSTLYSTMIHNGLPKKFAESASERIFVQNLEGHDGLADLDENGPFVVLGATNFDKSGQFTDQHRHNDWPSLVHLIAHETTHISSEPNMIDLLTEDYGPLGKAYLSNGISGFSSAEEKFEGPFNFIRPVVPAGELPNTIEEWAAEVGRINYIREMGTKGLSENYTKSVEESRLSCRCHSFLEPSIRQAFSSQAQNTFGEVFTPVWLQLQHREKLRSQTFLVLGREILLKNSNQSIANLAESTIRAVGMLGFSAFVFEQGYNTPLTIQALINTPINDQRVLELAGKHQEFLNNIYPSH